MDTVFISYSHKDEQWKDRLLKHLQVLACEKLLNSWHDRDIEPGTPWFDRIMGELNQAGAVVMLISSDYLTSSFILEEEVPIILRRLGQEEIKLFPLIVEPCPWEEVSWLSALTVLPKDGQALSTFNDAGKAETQLVEIAKKILHLLNTGEKKPAKLPLSHDNISLYKLL